LLVADSTPTPYAGVNAVLAELLGGVQAILRERLLGMYLYGSLALGDFDPDSSDVDFLAVTDEVLPPETLAALTALHERIFALDSPWTKELEGSYVPQAALRRFERANARHPRIDRGEAELSVRQHEVDSVFQRYVLRERGVTLVGPPPVVWMDPITHDDLREATLELMRIWWAPMTSNLERLYHPGYQAYAVLTMCRMLYTLDRGGVVSKPAAARWAIATQKARWAPLIERALGWRRDEEVDRTGDVPETGELIRYVAAHCREEGRGHKPPSGEAV
jgi:predicted nucleotidyltransferase